MEEMRRLIIEIMQWDERMAQECLDGNEKAGAGGIPLRLCKRMKAIINIAPDAPRCTCCGDMLIGHEDETTNKCRFCVTTNRNELLERKIAHGCTDMTCPICDGQVEGCE